MLFQIICALVMLVHVGAEPTDFYKDRVRPIKDGVRPIKDFVHGVLRQAKPTDQYKDGVRPTKDGVQKW